MILSEDKKTPRNEGFLGDLGGFWWNSKSYLIFLYQLYQENGKNAFKTD
jgi:hypothetical protein